MKIRNPDATCGFLILFCSFAKVRCDPIIVFDIFSNGSKELLNKCIEKILIFEKEVRI